MKRIGHLHDVVVVGGGLTGIMAAVTAARKGVRVALVQDRPVLGGNASKEIRVPPVGASNCNFAYARETGLVEELFLNNLYRNPTWNFEGWNLEFEALARNEANITLHINTAVSDVEMNEAGDRIQAVKAYCSPAETWHRFAAPYFIDCSGDGIVGALAGALYRRGIEARSEFGEKDCTEEASAETMGNTLQMRARDAGRPVPFVKPKWVDREVTLEDFGPYRPVCQHFFPDSGGFWWMEWGGALDTIHQSEEIKDEVQKLVLAVWDFLKNRSELAQRLTNYELDWLGCVSGKRESRRFEGDHILTVGDIESQAHFDDAVAYGGWGIDHHPAGGFYDRENPSTHRHLPGPHNIPLRSLYSRNVHNLYVAGRNLSATHYALSSTRVMLTCAQLGEAVGMAVAHSVATGNDPRALVAGQAIAAIQKDLIQNDHYIHDLHLEMEGNLAPKAVASASSVHSDRDEVTTWAREVLDARRMLKLPIVTSTLDSIALLMDVKADTSIEYQLYGGPENHSTYPESLVTGGTVAVKAGQRQWVVLPLKTTIERPGWHFVVVNENADVALHVTEAAPGRRRYYPRPPDPIRPDPYCAWTSRSVPIGSSRSIDVDGAKVPLMTWSEHALERAALSPFLNYAYAAKVTPEQSVYTASETIGRSSRPVNTPGLWVSKPTAFDHAEWVTLTWEQPMDLSRIQILFDSSLHFHFWQSWRGYPSNTIPSLVKDYRIVATLANGRETLVASVTENYHRHRVHKVDLTGVVALRIEVERTNGIDRAQIYSIRVFGQRDPSAPGANH